MRASYDAKPSVRYGALMHELRVLGVRLDFVTNEAWNRYREYWVGADFKASLRRLHITKRALDNEDVTPNDVLLYVYTKDHDGVTFTDGRSARFHIMRRREEHTQVTLDQPVVEEQFYYNTTGDCPKGRVYGLGSLSSKKRKYGDPSASIVITSRAPPPPPPPPPLPPPQEHHQQVGVDPAHSSEHQHNNDDQDIWEWMDEEHLSDER
ncbi:hypothetical protein Scep_012675 [Stephania cephalantha]|uniref:Uncharacterized protein n=1 Tax=Stephania cephalantha TaxID=152367 RepID=A0AAP0P6P6_9MAGN